MERTIRAAILLTGLVVFLAVGCARSMDIDLDQPVSGADDDEPIPFWTVVWVAAFFAAIPLAMIWVYVLVTYVARRGGPSGRDEP